MTLRTVEPPRFCVVIPESEGDVLMDRWDAMEPVSELRLRLNFKERFRGTFRELLFGWRLVARNVMLTQLGWRPDGRYDAVFTHNDGRLGVAPPGSSLTLRIDFGVPSRMEK